MDYNIHTGIYGLILNEQCSKILLIKKVRGPYKGLYDLPGGSPNFEETLEQTLEREILEETGLEIISMVQLVTLVTIFKKGVTNYRHLGVIYSVVARGILKLGADGEDSDGSIWFDIDKISESSCSPFVVLLKEKGLLNKEFFTLL